MIKVFDINSIPIEKVIERTKIDYSAYVSAVEGIISRVESEGDKALFDLSEKYDGAKLDTFKVSQEEIDGAFASADENYISSLKQAIENITAYHKMQIRQGFEFSTADGAILGQRVIPVESVCVYVPGGTAAYPSTVLMCAVPAKLAGVKNIYLTSPAKGGVVNNDVLVAAKLAGVTEIYKLGGAQAIAAFARGTENVPKVDKIVGPGNVYVATAKRLLFGEIGIDMFAGPSEILVVADKNASARNVAADMLSQAEHDKLASAILVTNSATLAKAVSEEIEKQLPLLARAEIARESVDKLGKIILANNLDEVVDVANLIAPEHLELAVENPFDYLDRIKNAGSVFLGYCTPEAVGDYIAGANHTLPTGGTARFSSALSIDDFVKKTQYVCYSEKALENARNAIKCFAEKEGLGAHARSVEIRFEEKDK